MPPAAKHPVSRSGQLRNVRLCKSAKELISSTSAAHACSVFPYRTSTACIRTASGLLSSRGRQPPRHKHQRQNPTVGRTAALRYCTVSALTPPEDLICPLTIFQRTAISGYVLQWKILPNQSNTHVQPTVQYLKLASLGYEQPRTAAPAYCSRPLAVATTVQYRTVRVYSSPPYTAGPSE